MPGNASTSACVVYETEFADFVDARARKAGESILEYLMDCWAELKSSCASVPDCIWYCSSSESRESLEEYAEAYATVHDKLIFVRTKCELLEKFPRDKEPKAVESVWQDKTAALKVSTTACLGLNKLMRQTLLIALKSCKAAKEPGFESKWFKSISRKENVWDAAIEKEVESYLNWAACRAFAIAIVPLPLADVGPLVANEAYMIYRIGSAYGYTVDKTIITGFLGCIGASCVGLCLASFLPFLKAPIAAGVTYGVGHAANAWFKSGMTLSEEELRGVFSQAKEKAKGMTWVGEMPK